MLGDIFGAVGDYYGAKRQSQGMKDAVDGYNQELEATRERMYDLSEDQLGGAYDDINDMYGSYRDAGQTGLDQLNNREQYRTDTGQFNYDKGVEDFLDPSMEYEMEQAMRGINSGAGASNQSMSGATLKALSDRNQAIARQNYGNAYNMMSNDRNNAYQQFSDDFNRRRAVNQDMYNQDQNMVNIGQNATGNTANARQTYGSGMVSSLAPSYGSSNQSKAGIHDMVMGGMYGKMGKSLGNLMSSGAKAYATGGMSEVGETLMGMK